MASVRRIIQGTFTIIAVSCLGLVLLVSSGCWDDDCPEGCEAGYACYYGVCLSRGMCKATDPNATRCAQKNSSGECTQEVEHGICNDGFVCVCHIFDPSTGQCDPSSRVCEPIPTDE